MRCRSLLAYAAVAALASCLAALTAGAQVAGGGGAAEDGAVQATPTPRPPGRGRITSGGDLVVSSGARLRTDLVAGATGDPDLSGSADLVVSPRRGTLCFDIDLDGPDVAKNVVAVHVHPGQAATPCDVEDCAPVIDLEFPDEGLEGCARAGRHLLSSLVEEPEQFYLHVHTSRFPDGAASGQLEED